MAGMDKVRKIPQDSCEKKTTQRQSGCDLCFTPYNMLWGRRSCLLQMTFTEWLLLAIPPIQSSPIQIDSLGAPI